MDAPAIVSVRALTKRFGATLALDKVDVEIGPGATGILGPNGAGKTTLLRVLLGLLRAEGEAAVLGLAPARSPRQVRARIGYMPESECLIPGLGAVDIVAFTGRLAGMPRRDAFKRAHDVLYYVGLGEERYRDAREFSQGMQQRLKLAAALVHDPGVLFLDEPTNGLDPKGREEMLTLIREMAERHAKHVLLCSHLLHDVEQVCRNVVMLRAGRVARQGPIRELTSGEHGSWLVTVRGEAGRFGDALRAAGAEGNGATPLLVRLPQGAGTELLFRAAREAGVQVRGLQPVRRSLEDVFMDAVDERGGPGAGESDAG